VVQVSVVNTLITFVIILNTSWVLVAYVCNLSYSRSRDQGDGGSKPGWAKFVRPCLKKTHHKKRAGGVAQGVGPEFKS
jgi:hypothetical protein